MVFYLDWYNVKLNIFRNPFIDSQVGYLIDSYEDGLRKQTESYWRNKISEEIKRFGLSLDSTIPVSENDIHHGEHFLRHWSRYVVENCASVARGEVDEKA